MSRDAYSSQGVGMGRVCPVCGSSEWGSFLKLSNGRSLTSDQRIVPHSLDKIICESCGVVSNRVLLGSERLDDYEESYELNTSGAEEHIYFGWDGQMTRSRAIFGWLRPYLPETAGVVLEIGCGMGNLLSHVKELYPGSVVIGIEANRHAAGLARKRHSDIRQQFVGRNAPSLPSADLVIAYGVAEHVEDLADFLGAIRLSCRNDATIVLCVPIQDQGGYDLFFSDHIWHFTAAQFETAIVRAGFSVSESNFNSSVVSGFGLVVARPGMKNPSLPLNEASLQIANRDHWRLQFSKANDRIKSIGTRSVALFGASEVFSLLMAYTELGGLRIEVCLDEDQNKIGRMKHCVPVHPPAYVESNPVDAVLLTVNPRYNEMIRGKLSALGTPIISCID